MSEYQKIVIYVDYVMTRYDDKGYYVGFRSVFDRKKEIKFEFFPRNDSLIKYVKSTDDLNNLIRFSQQFYTADKYSDTVVFNDLRFGQVIGWHSPREKFAFHYYLQYPNDNALVVQRGRFAQWNWEVVNSLLKRIKGN